MSAVIFKAIVGFYLLHSDTTFERLEAGYPPKQPSFPGQEISIPFVTVLNIFGIFGRIERTVLGLQLIITSHKWQKI